MSYQRILNDGEMGYKLATVNYKSVTAGYKLKAGSGICTFVMKAITALE